MKYLVIQEAEEIMQTIFIACHYFLVLVVETSIKFPSIYVLAVDKGCMFMWQVAVSCAFVLQAEERKQMRK